MLPGSELVTLDCDHFSLYMEKNWEFTIQKQLQFMRKHASEEGLQFEVGDGRLGKPQGEKVETLGSKAEL